MRVSGSPGSRGTATMGEMKAAMRESMNNIKIYGNDPQLNTGHGSQSRASMKSPKAGAGSPKRASGVTKSPSHGK